jgi:hypothetical protein
VVARLCLIFSILLAGDSTLPNGIRVYEVSGDLDAQNSFELTAGYRTVGLGEISGARGLKEVVDAFLKSTASVRAIEVAAYGAGGKVEYFSDPDRTGIRLKMPKWARSMVESSVAEFLSETPQKNMLLVDRALEEVRIRQSSRSDIRSGVENQLRLTLMGPGAQSDLANASRESVNAFFAKYYGTNRAFAVTNSAPLETLQSVERRVSEDPMPKTEASPGTALPDRLPRVPTDLDEGGVILGVRTPSIYYRGWYEFLLLDRLIVETLPSKPETELLPSLEPYYYRMAVKVPSGRTVETVEAALREDLNQMQYVRATNAQLESARRSALQYLESEPVERWFVSLGVPERRLEGLDWVRSFSADDMRATARNLVGSYTVVGSWSPKVRELRLESVLLSDVTAKSASPSTDAATKLPALSSVKRTPFPPHVDAPFTEKGPARLESGVSIVESSSYAVFVGPDTQGSLTFFSSEPGLNLLETSFGTYRPERILVMAPPQSLERLREQWSRFKGNPNDATVMVIDGKIPGPHLPSLFVLKMLLDRRLIEAGMWSDVRLEIRAVKGSTLTIAASDADRRRVLTWIEEIAMHPIPKEDADWAREAAIHHVSEFLPDLQSLVWEWTPDGTIFDFHLVPTALIQDVARMYLQ